MANVREAIELYVEDCIAAGDPKQALQRAGFVLTRQRGSHMILRRDDLARGWSYPITNVGGHRG